MTVLSSQDDILTMGESKAKVCVILCGMDEGRKTSLADRCIDPCGETTGKLGRQSLAPFRFGDLRRPSGLPSGL
jgi:hypothetical protein